MLSLSSPSFFKILELPKHLQTTLMVLMKLGKGTADEVATVTHRSRAVESGYLNTLTVMKICEKRRAGRKAVFTVKYESLDW